MDRMNLLWIPFSVVIGIAAIVALNADFGLCSAGATVAINKNEAFSCGEYWLNRYQSLISGLLALLGAILAFVAVRRQILSTENLAEAARSRKEDSITAISTVALDAMVDYADKCLLRLIEFRQKILDKVADAKFDIPSLPQEALLSLKDYIEFGNASNASIVAVLIYSSQIQNSRLNDFADSSRLYDDAYFDLLIQNALFDAADVRAQSDALFPSVRKDYRERTHKLGDIINSLAINGIDISDFDHLKSRVESFVVK